MMIIAGPLAKGITKIGAQIPYVLGSLLLAGMLALFMGTPTGGSYTKIMLPITALLGVGLVLCLIPTPTVGTSEATEEDAGTTSAVLNVSTQVGGALGLAISATLVQNHLNHLLAAGVSELGAVNQSLHQGISSLFVWVGLSVLTGLIGFRKLDLSAQPPVPAPTQTQRPAAAVTGD
jgi:hypothetical protein